MNDEFSSAVNDARNYLIAYAHAASRSSEGGRTSTLAQDTTVNDGGSSLEEALVIVKRLHDTSRTTFPQEDVTGVKDVQTVNAILELVCALGIAIPLKMAQIMLPQYPIKDDSKLRTEEPSLQTLRAIFDFACSSMRETSLISKSLKTRHAMELMAAGLLLLKLDPSHENGDVYQL